MLLIIILSPTAHHFLSLSAPGSINLCPHLTFYHFIHKISIFSASLAGATGDTSIGCAITEQWITNLENPTSVPGQLPVGGVGETVEERYEDPCEPVHDVGWYVGLAVLGVGVHLDHHGGREGAEEVGEEDADDDPGHPLLPPEPLLLPVDVL